MRRTDPAPATVRLVRERDDWRCARCAGWGPLSTQHRVARGMGGTRSAWINEPPNLLTLCGSGTTQCHGWVERHPTWAQAHGWSVSRHQWQVVDAAPVWTWRGWVRLRPDGTLRQSVAYPGVSGCDCGCRSVETPAGLWSAPTL